MKLKSIPAVIALALFPLAAQANGMTTNTALNALNLNELALTYSQAKIAKATGSDSASQADAVLVDMGVITASDLANKTVLSAKLKAFVSDQTDASEYYIGNLSDKNIIERVLNKWNNSTVIQNDAIRDQLNQLIDKGYTTGYNVIAISDDSNFNAELMIRYGHNDINHAVQLIALMKGEGFDPKVQLTPKSSAFQYLPEWGEPGYTVIKMDSGKMISVVKEYNLDFEFQTAEQKIAFMGLINQYAKKDTADEKGLIVESWWQPFYRSYTKLDNYAVLTENNAILGDYKVDLMVLPKQAKLQSQQVSNNIEDVKIESKTVWVNPSFYRYMNGDFK